MEEKIYDTIIIGSGPAGFTAAIYTARGAASTLILAGTSWGGQLMLTSEVDNFPGFPEGIMGPELMSKMKDQAVRFGAEFVQADVTKTDFSKSPLEVYSGEKKYQAKSVIVATGASTVWLDVPGIKELIGKGVASCAPCDAPFYKDKRVAVVGGGDSAMEEALYLTKYASEVTIIHRRDAFRASAVMQEKVKANPKIKIMWKSEVVEAKGKDKLESLVIKDNQNGQNQEIPFDGVFIAIGHKPQSEVFAGQIEADEKGFVKIAGSHSKTSVPGIFVAGDVMDQYYKQAITAAGSGCAAAMEALEYLDNLK